MKPVCFNVQAGEDVQNSFESTGIGVPADSVSFWEGLALASGMHRDD